MDLRNDLIGWFLGTSKAETNLTAWTVIVMMCFLIIDDVYINQIDRILYTILHATMVTLMASRVLLRDCRCAPADALAHSSAVISCLPATGWPQGNQRRGFPEGNHNDPALARLYFPKAPPPANGVSPADVEGH